LEQGGSHKRPGLWLTVAWTGVLAASLSFGLWQIHQATLESARVTARASFEKDILYRAWNARHGGVYARVSELAQPNPWLDVPDRDLETADGVALTMINPAYMTRQVFELTEARSGVKSHITSLRPRNPGNRPDPWEAEALARFEQGEREVSGLHQQDGDSYLRLMRPLWVEPPCLKCHADQGYSVGEVRGGISVKVPLASFAGTEQRQMLGVAGGHLAIWLLGLFGVRLGVGRYRQQQQAELAAALSRKETAALQLVMDGVAESIILVDDDYLIRMANPAAVQFHGRSDILGRPCYEVIHHRDSPCEHSPVEPCPLRAAREQRQPVRVSHEHLRGDGRQRVVELLATPLWDAAGGFKGVIKVSRDVTERVQAERQLRHLAHHDTLTQLPNRLNFEDQLARELAGEEARGQGVALLFIDLDRFKNINDTLGHNIGDQVLVEISRRLRDAVAPRHLVARFGGDEFTVVLRGAPGGEVVEVVDALLRHIAAPLSIQGYSFFISASIGIALFPQDGATLTELMKSADTALYRAKGLGRNTYQFYDQGTDLQTLQRLQLESSLRHAIDAGALRVVYQPQVVAASGELAGVEALCRWDHETFGTIPPDDFIPIAEETGLIVELGQQVMRQACAQAQQWFLRHGRRLRVAVNVSTRQLLRIDLEAEVRIILEETGLPAEFLELEITESAIMQDVAAAVEVLQRLRGLGVSVAIDDFGTGYSSLSYLKQFPIDALKIDKSFVRELSLRESDAAVVKTIISLARNLGLYVVAEGVEHEEQRQFLIREGCDLLQGYLFSRPLRPEALERQFLVR
jgi:diguanylate cyclase (GGDEF)-like protein/PAS domain S-box-containing protein